MSFKFGTEIGLTERDIEILEPEIEFVTTNTEIEAIAITTVEGFQIAFAAVPGYHLDSDAFCGIASALTMTGKTTLMSVFQRDLDEIIVRAANGYIVVTNAGKFVLVGASRLIKSMMQTVKTFRESANRISQHFPGS
ncbi:MAG: roadblock/LC7 domain-containing protein [Promethearchaeota archaeon]